MKIKNNSDEPLRVADAVVMPGQIGEVRGDVWARLKAERPEFKKKIESQVYEELLLLPGDGKFDCQLCLGRGAIVSSGANGTPTAKRCDCVKFKDVKANVAKIWPQFDLNRVGRLPEGSRSPLQDYANRNLYVTASEPIFKMHLRHTAVRQGAFWGARVHADVSLFEAWFFTAKAKGAEIYDVNVRDTPLSEYPSIPEMVIPPELLILLMGVKNSRNVASPELLRETLKLRDFAGKPTWVVDQPNQIVTETHHLFYSAENKDWLDAWNHVTLDLSRTRVQDPDEILENFTPTVERKGAEPGGAVQPPTPTRAPGKFKARLSDLHGAHRGSTTTEDLVEPADEWQPENKRGKKR